MWRPKTPGSNAVARTVEKNALNQEGQRYIAYASEEPSLEYERSTDGENWTITTAVTGECHAPSISTGSWPVPGFVLGSRSPVIAYVDDA